MDQETLISLIISVTVFGVTFSVWCLGILVWFRKYLLKLRMIQGRLGISSELAERGELLRLWRDIQIRQETEHFGLHQNSTFSERINHWMEDAGWHVPFHMFVLGVLALGFVTFLVMYVTTAKFWLGICVTIAVLYLFMEYVQKRIHKRTNLFERQLLDALGVAARALRAGHPLVGAFQLISEEIGEPLGSLFNQIHQEQALGSDLKESIRQAAKDNRNNEFRLFSTAISVQLHSGGNLADLMDSLATVIRSRMRLNRRVRVLTAQTQFSKMILIALPIIMFILLNAINPQYMEPLYTTPEGNTMLSVMFVNLLFGVWVMNKLVKIKY